MSEDAVRTAFAEQAGWCDGLDAPFTARLMRVCARRLSDRTAPGRRILAWSAGDPGSRADAVPLRLAAALHGLVLSGRHPALAALYPPAGLPDEDTLWRAVESALHDHAADIDDWLDHAPQTNEVTRCAPLMAGLRVLAARTGASLALFEVGASAGLNLLADRYRVTTGSLTGGPAISPVQIAPDWTGPNPPDVQPAIAARRGVDLHPLDVTDPAHQVRLLSFVWPDQPERLARLRAAIGIAAADPPTVDTGDAAPWVERHLRATDRDDGRVRVLWHSIAFQYFPAATQDRITRHMDGAGTGTAWLRFETPPAATGGVLRPELRLRMPDGSEHLLGTGHGLGQHFTWLAGSAPSG